MNSYAAMAVDVPSGTLHLKQLASPKLDRRGVRVRVEASGVCNADLGLIRTKRPQGGFPIVPGHEIAGVVEAVGEDVRTARAGDRVAVGWFGGSCGHCAFCRAGDPVHCRERKTPGVDYQGGWAQFVTVPEDAIAHMPAGLDFADAAPFGCAGVTVFNALREAQVRPGGTVAVFGLGGLGHLAVQFSAALGYQTIVIARGDERRVPAKTFGAIDYVDVLKDNAGEALEALGGAELIVYTASDSAPLAGLLRGLRTRGKLMLVGVDGGEVRVPVAGVVLNEQSITGHLTGTPLQTEEAMRFAVAHGIRPALELAPLTEADAVAQRLSSGRVRFRAVLDPWHGER